jgi:hypothetical protein
LTRALFLPRGVHVTRSLSTGRGCWMSRDSTPGEPRYVYAWNDPEVQIDASGSYSCCVSNIWKMQDGEYCGPPRVDDAALNVKALTTHFFRAAALIACAVDLRVEELFVSKASPLALSAGRCGPVDLGNRREGDRRRQERTRISPGHHALGPVPLLRPLC